MHAKVFYAWFENMFHPTSFFTFHLIFLFILKKLTRILPSSYRFHAKIFQFLVFYWTILSVNVFYAYNIIPNTWNLRHHSNGKSWTMKNQWCLNLPPFIHIVFLFMESQPVPKINVLLFVQYYARPAPNITYHRRIIYISIVDLTLWKHILFTRNNKCVIVILMIIKT